MSDNLTSIYGTLTCRSKFKPLTKEEEERQCKFNNSFPSVNENRWIAKLTGSKKK
jgi:hypothetical protein|nr:MAG TPA: Protein of unknown function (DUF2737) [Caudoviricetes sp.]